MLVSRVSATRILTIQFRTDGTPLNAVNSSNVKAYAYDPTRNTLYIEFLNGRIYSYSNVPPSVANEFGQASSHGQYLNQNIKPRYTAKQVSREDIPDELAGDAASTAESGKPQPGRKITWSYISDYLTKNAEILALL